MLLGPKGFAAGVQTGVRGAVKGVVGGGFESLSKVSGGLYSVIKQTAGAEDYRNHEKAETFGQGLKQGARGAGAEVIKGVTGIISQPVQGAKQGGIKGFAKGLGKGLVQAAATPVTGVLRAGESVSQGISATAHSIGNIGKSKIDTLDPKLVRIRPNRRIDVKGQIKIYDQNLAIINHYLR